mmetsp:Transcript_2878/g.9364  ORF Transcript_2878/g.9364 Transcript_2878/m.9364 type:complete len:150 (-) Transcript_2878:218-667(-)
MIRQLDEEVTEPDKYLPSRLVKEAVAAAIADTKVPPKVPEDEFVLQVKRLIDVSELHKVCSVDLWQVREAVDHELGVVARRRTRAQGDTPTPDMSLADILMKCRKASIVEALERCTGRKVSSKLRKDELGGLLVDAFSRQASGARVSVE